MDVGFYISELLELHGEVNVPGLGHLIQTRVSGYYNASDFKFYPPHNEVKFDHSRLNEDHVLTQYIADKKNISLESSQYFTEKYITNLKEDALYNDVPVANVGWFYNDNGKLAFKANKTSTDPVFYGYPAVRASKLLSQGTTAPIEAPEPEPIVTTPPVAETINEPIAEQEETVEELYYEEPESNKALRIVLYLLAAAILIITVAYLYKPSAFKGIESYFGTKSTAPKKTTIIKADTNASPADTTLKADTTVKTTAPVVATKTAVTTPVTSPPNTPLTTPTAVGTSANQYAIIVYSATSMDQATTRINEYRANGVDAYIVPGTKAPKIKISAGTFNSLDEARAAMAQLIKSRKIYGDAYAIKLK
jgi:cell division septation protein DedD